ncbi:DUF1801 domain-containing protein [Candidatus Viadribacter manganicus]|uniref:YdhG-like domain-containing protein n=1 Tax=Candidatus Viadribacter manganicus TaxID=1759059 RepID=A0A1B1AFU8_9PROT|nr:DUF1801 domain-containing protein [Candidatus Viadribacter manganicus]ANP45439.1 hypothetical protein ATE48_05670 [Candidatus Viadribacter manganicus]
MAEPKTQKTKASVAAFIAAVEDDTRRKDAKSVDKMMRDVTGEKPAMWGPSIIGYGEYKIPTGTWPRLGFSPRKANLVLYVLGDFKGCGALLKKLGKHKTGRSCLYINKLADVDEAVLRELTQASWSHMNAKYD